MTQKFLYFEMAALLYIILSYVKACNVMNQLLLGVNFSKWIKEIMPLPHLL